MKKNFEKNYNKNKNNNLIRKRKQTDSKEECRHSYILHPEEEILYCEDCGKLINDENFRENQKQVKRLCWHHFFFKKCYRKICQFSHSVTFNHIKTRSDLDAREIDEGLKEITLCINHFKGKCNAAKCKYNHSLTYLSINPLEQSSFDKWEKDNVIKSQFVPSRLNKDKNNISLQHHKFNSNNNKSSHQHQSINNNNNNNYDEEDNLDDNDQYSYGSPPRRNHFHSSSLDRDFDDDSEDRISYNKKYKNYK